MMNILNNDIIITHILTKAPQLGLTCKEFYKYIPKITKNLKYPTNNKHIIYLEKDNLKFEYEQKINLERLTKLLEHPLVKTLSISTQHKIFLEMKSIFLEIIDNELSIINNWKYRDIFIDCYNEHKYKKSFVNFSWLDSIITSIIFYLYH